jgi:hypothetical protein
MCILHSRTDGVLQLKAAPVENPTLTSCGNDHAVDTFKLLFGVMACSYSRDYLMVGRRVPLLQPISGLALLVQVVTRAPFG